MEPTTVSIARFHTSRAFRWWQTVIRVCVGCHSSSVVYPMDATLSLDLIPGSCPSTANATLETGIKSPPTLNTHPAGDVSIASSSACVQEKNIHPGARSEWTKVTLSTHHANFLPEDNNPENLIVLCTPCHLALHARAKRSNVSPGQLSLW